MTTDLDLLKQTRLPWGPGLANLTVLHGTVTTRSPLHVGSGILTGNVNEAVREAGNGYPYIPATSLRGVLRAWLTSVLAPYGEEVCTLDPQPLAAGIGGQGKRAAERDAVRAEALRCSLDLVSGLFGSTEWKSKVEIDPARIPKQARKKDKGPDGLLAKVTQVAIDPVLGAADEGKLFETEFVLPDTTFQVQIRVRNARKWELGMLLLALESLNNRTFPTRVGGHTQQGYGELTWTLERAEHIGTLSGDKPGPEVLRQWVDMARGKHPALPDAKARSFRDECMEDLATRGQVLFQSGG